MSIWDRDGNGDLTTLGEQQQQEWLSEDNEKIIICDIVFYNKAAGTTQVGYFSNYPYITPHTDSFTPLNADFYTPALPDVNNIPYVDILINIPNIISKIDSDINIGAIEFLNADGEFDEYITYAWEGWPLRIYIGDKSWIKDDFILILEAVSSVISSPRPNIMSLGIRDKKEVFNVKVQTQLITEDYVENVLYKTGILPVFEEKLDNLLTRSKSVEVVLAVNPNDVNQTYTGLQVADATITALNAIPEFTVTGLDTGIITITHNLPSSPAPEASHDGNDDLADERFNTYFDFTSTMTGSGIIGDLWEETITVGLGNYSSTDLNEKYFHVYTPYRSHYVWYNLNNGSVDPEVVDVTPVDFLPSNKLVPETIENTPVPICLGKCFNIEPKLIDSNNHVYQVHEGEIQQIIQVRSNGIPLDTDQYEINLVIGCFRLLVHSRSTQITCDVIGAKTRGLDQNNTRANISIDMHTAPMMVEWLALEKTSLLAADICVDTFSNADLGNDDILGLYIPNEIEVAPLITDIMASIGGFARFHRTCTLQILRLTDPDLTLTADIEFTLNDDLIKEKGLSLSATEVPYGSMSLGYDKNWTVQDKGALAGLINDSDDEDFLEFLNLYTNEYRSAVENNVGIKDEYPLAKDKDLVGTLISDFGYYLNSNTYINPTTKAQDEVTRRIGLRSKKRYVYKIQSTVAPFTLNVGDVIKVVHNRFGFKWGKNCVIIGMDEKPTQQRVDLEIWL